MWFVSTVRSALSNAFIKKTPGRGLDKGVVGGAVLCERVTFYGGAAC